MNETILTRMVMDECGGEVAPKVYYVTETLCRPLLHLTHLKAEAGSGSPCVDVSLAEVDRYVRFSVAPEDAEKLAGQLLVAVAQTKGRSYGDYSEECMIRSGHIAVDPQGAWHFTPRSERDANLAI